MIKIVEVHIGAAKLHTRQELEEIRQKRKDGLAELNNLVKIGYEVIGISPITVGISGIMIYTLQSVDE